MGSKVVNFGNGETMCEGHVTWRAAKTASITFMTDPAVSDYCFKITGRVGNCFIENEILKLTHALNFLTTP